MKDNINLNRIVITYISSRNRMWPLLLTSAFFLCILLPFLQKQFLDKWQNLPPGPLRFPIIGCIVQILIEDLKFPFVAFQKLANYYGNLYYIQIGVVKMVVANGYEVVHKIYQSDDFIARTDDELWLLDRTYGKAIGIVGASPDVWKETRRVCSKNLREFGFGIKNKMEHFILEELEELCAQISHLVEQTNGVLPMTDLFPTPVLNIVWSMVSGYRFSYGDKKLTELLKVTEDWVLSLSFSSGALTAYPFLLKYAPKLIGYDKLVKCNRVMQKYIENILTEIRAQKEYIQNPTNFIEVYLQKIDTREVDNSLDDTIYSHENLVSVLYDFFITSSDIASSVLVYAILCLVLNPEVQKRLHNEIDIVIGDTRTPEISDEEKMVYTEATMLEVLRIGTVAPIAPRKTVRDTYFGNHRIPKDTRVLLNLYSVAVDKEFWGDPEVFRPERFIDSSGKIINADRILSFGAGKRNCMGESIARTAIFTILTGLLQKFSFALNPAEKKPSVDLTNRVFGFSLTPKPFSVIVNRRK